MAQDGTQLVQSLADGVNARDYDGVGALLADDVEFADMAAGQTVRGRDATLAVIRMWLSAFPDMKLELVASVADGGRAAAEVIGSGTQDGTLVTPAGDVPPTGRFFRDQFTWFVDHADGRVTGWRDYYNALSMLTQLGLMPESAA